MRRSTTMNSTLAKAVGETPINCSRVYSNTGLAAGALALDTPYQTGYLIKQIAKAVAGLA